MGKSSTILITEWDWQARRQHAFSLSGYANAACKPHVLTACGMAWENIKEMVQGICTCTDQHLCQAAHRAALVLHIFTHETMSLRLLLISSLLRLSLGLSLYPQKWDSLWVFPKEALE